MSAEKLDPLTPLGRQILNEIKEKEVVQPGWIAPGNKYMLADPVELGFVPVRPKIDWAFIRGLAYIPGNEYEEAA